MTKAINITQNNSLFIINPHKDKSGGGYMRKYEYNGTQYTVNSQYTKERTLSELLEEVVLDRYKKQKYKTYSKTCGL